MAKQSNNFFPKTAIKKKKKERNILRVTKEGIFHVLWEIITWSVIWEEILHWSKVEQQILTAYMDKFELFCANFTDIWDQIMGFTFVGVFSRFLVKPQSCVLLLVFTQFISISEVRYFNKNTIYTWKESSSNLKISLVDLDISLTEKSLLWQPILQQQITSAPKGSVTLGNTENRGEVKFSRSCSESEPPERQRGCGNFGDIF